MSSVIRVNYDQSVIRVVQVDGSPTIRVSNLGVQGPTGSRLVEVVYAIAGLVPSSRTLIGYIASANITFIPADAVAIAGTSNTNDTTITITELDNTPVGTIFFGAGLTTGVVTISAVTLAKNDGLKFVHPGSVNTLADMVVTLPANRGN